MASQVDIANRALSKIGDKRIIAFTDDTKQARAINSAFALVRDAEMRKHRWSFTIKRDQLAAATTAPSFGYAYRFQLPTDCLRVLEVGKYFPAPSTSNLRNGPDSAWAVEGRYVLSDEAGPLYLRYIASITDTTLWDACFCEVLACKLAFELADELSASLERKDSCQREYVLQLSEARHANAIELPPSGLPDDTWVTCRIQG